MHKSRIALLSAVASLALLAGGAAYAQSRTAQHARPIEVPPGAVVLVLPGGMLRVMPMAMPMSGPMVDAAFPFPSDMMRQMDQMMADTQRVFDSPAWTAPDQSIEAAMRGMPQAGGPVAGVVVTSFSDGHSTCTRRITYSGNGAAPKVEVSATGGGCASAGIPTAAPSTPAAMPDVVTPQPAVPHTLRVENRTRMTPLQVAELGN
jgi:hypothetical protein